MLTIHYAKIKSHFLKTVIKVSCTDMQYSKKKCMAKPAYPHPIHLPILLFIDLPIKLLPKPFFSFMIIKKSPNRECTHSNQTNINRQFPVCK